MTQTTRRAIEDRTKALTALQVRMSGATLQQVADRVGYNSRQSVWNAIKRVLDHDDHVVASEFRAMHVARLERLLLGVWNAAIGGDDKASQQALRILIEIGKVTGVAAPIKVEATGPGGGPIEHAAVLQWMPDEEWMRKYATAWEEVRAAHATPVGELTDEG